MEQIVLRVLFAVLPFAVLGIASTIVLSRIFKRLNKRLPKREQSEFFGAGPAKSRESESCTVNIILIVVLNMGDRAGSIGINRAFSIASDTPSVVERHPKEVI